MRSNALRASSRTIQLLILLGLSLSISIARAEPTASETIVHSDSSLHSDIAPPAETGTTVNYDPRGARAVLREETFARYSLLTWSDAFESLPGGRVNRFGPQGFYETYRIDGLGAPTILYEGVPVPGAGSGLTSGNALPFAGVGRLAIMGPSVGSGDARANADGAVILTAEPWVGGIPRSLVWVDQGASGYQRYLARFARDLGTSAYVRAHFQFRQNSSFVPAGTENYRGREIDLRFGGASGVIRYELGYWTYADEQYVFDDSLRGEGGFSHTGEEQKQIVRLRLDGPGRFSALLFGTGATGDAVPLAGDTAFAGEERRDGVVLSVPYAGSPGAMQFSVRVERREATAGAETRDRWESGGYAELTRSLSLADFTIRAGAVVQSGAGATVIGNGEIRFDRLNGNRGSHVSYVRARREASAELFARGVDDFGIANQAEAGFHAPGAGGKWSVRYAYRVVENARTRMATDPFFAAYAEYEERAHIVEASYAWEAGPLATEFSYLFSRSREEGVDQPPPYQSDHLARGRVALSRVVPYIQALGRLDLLGTWRSDRFAPGQTVPMDDFYYMRGRFTLELRGADVYVQAERILGHRLEYRDGIAGAPGVLSGTFQIYFGVRWPLED